MKDFIEKQSEQAVEEIRPLFAERDRISEANQRKVMKAFRNHQISDFHFQASTGYGYDDVGRDTLEQVYAEVFGTDAGLVRPQIVSGTHAISTALFGILRPGDELMYITGNPYDTLEEVIGIRGGASGSLKDFSIDYSVIPLKNQQVDLERVKTSMTDKTKIVGIQRSCGYDDRPSFNISQIKQMVDTVKAVKPDAIVFVDNCYGEFVETDEPCDVGADLMAGSLIKNPGGGIVKTGGYIVGKEQLINQCANRLAAPGIGKEGGASLYSLLEMYQGFFLAPHIVNQAVKGAMFTAKLLEGVGMATTPSWHTPRTDLIQSVTFPNAEMMIAFCQAIQGASPVDAHVKPQPSYMPGYEDDVIMAAGTFIQGASIELTADGPLRAPYRAYVQGGLTFEHVKIGVMDALGALIDQGLLKDVQKVRES
ncbi:MULTISPECIES: methionine gamma-lyase family protein [Bacillaceae]|uniref:methionine gamma-lyase family protein n=1 Tax=Alteribacter populi TaxID=2011011 RepID=UPI000BBB6449